MTQRNADSLPTAAVISVLLAAMVIFQPMNLDAQESSPTPGQRVVLITGSTGGLGRETARALARRGDHVIIHGRNVERAQELLAAIRAEGRGSARFYRADLASLSDTRRLANSILSDYERLE